MKFNVIMTVALLSCCVLLPSDAGAIKIRRETILLDGKNYRLEESTPVIATMLRSPIEREQLMGLEAVRDWAWQLQGSDLVVWIIDLFNGAKNSEVKATALAALCAVGDGRATEVFEKAAAYEDEFFKFGGLIGLANQRGPELVPRLIHAMVNSHAKVLTDSAWVTVGKLVGDHFPWPMKEVWKSESAKQKYLQEFALWWQANKARLDIEWKARHAADLKVISLKQRNQATGIVAGSRATSAVAQPPKKKVASTDKQEQNESLPPNMPQGKKRLLKLIVGASAMLAILSAFLWLKLKKKS